MDLFMYGTLHNVRTDVFFVVELLTHTFLISSLFFLFNVQSPDSYLFYFKCKRYNIEQLQGTNLVRFILYS